MTVSSLVPAIAATALAVVCAMGGIALAHGRRARFLVPFSGTLMVGAGAFGLLPEIARESGWPITLAIAGAGCLVLHGLEHFGYPVCPSCSHEAEFASPLIVAIGVHAFIDGWGMVAVAHRGPVSAAIVTSMLLHKIPEGLALGTMLRASRPRMAGALAILAETPTVLGGATGLWEMPANWVNFPLALAAGMFLFLGFHAIIPKR